VRKTHARYLLCERGHSERTAKSIQNSSALIPEVLGIDSITRRPIIGVVLPVLQPDASHQRKHDFGYGDKADGECDNGDGELVTDHSVGLGITGRLNDAASESLS
jgi:hypothetical protein